MIVSNSSPLITCGRQGILELLEKCFKKVVIPESVYKEISHKEDSAEVIALERAIKDKWIKVEKIGVSPFLQTKNLGQGEKEAISLAAKNKCQLLIDDDTAKSYASILDIESHGTFYVVYLACKKNFISKEESKKIIDRMVADDFYISTEIYSKFLDLLDGLK